MNIHYSHCSVSVVFLTRLCIDVDIRPVTICVASPRTSPRGPGRSSMQGPVKISTLVEFYTTNVFGFILPEVTFK